MRHKEPRLREAPEKRSSEITAPEHHTPDNSHVVTPTTTHRDSRRPRLFGLAAAAVALVLAVVSWIVIAGRQGIPASPPQTVTSAAPAPSSTDSTEATPTPEPSVSATPSLSPTPTETPTSHIPGTYSRAAIPWSEVGGSWSYVEYAMSEHPTSWALFLVSPWGARYGVGTYEASLADVSADGRRVLFVGNFYAMWVVDVATGTQHTIRGPGETHFESAALTRPSGQAVLLVEEGVGTPNLLQKIDVQTGSTQLSFGTDIAGVGSSPDGRYIVGRTGKPTVVILGNATGTLGAAVPTPTGATSCYPGRWWSNDELVIDCVVGEHSFDLWRYSVSTHAMTRITRSTTAQFGYTSAYPSAVGTVVQQGGSCSPGRIGILSSDGTTDTALKNIPNEGGTAPSLIGVVGTTAFLLFVNCGDSTTPDSSYVAYDLVTGTPVTLASGKSTGSGVYNARLVT